MDTPPSPPHHPPDSLAFPADPDILYSILSQLKAIDEDEIVQRLTSPRATPRDSPPSLKNINILNNQTIAASEAANNPPSPPSIVQFGIASLNPADLTPSHSPLLANINRPQRESESGEEANKKGSRSGLKSAAGSPPRSPRSVATDPYADPTIIGDFEYSSTMLGNGAYSAVYQGRSVKAHERVAVKVITLSSETMTAYLSEAKLHRLANGHPHIVRLYETIQMKSMGYLVFELCERGELFNMIAPNVGLRRDLVPGYFSQLVDAVDFLHSRGIAHLDIKPENVFIDHHGRVKLGDFGFSVLIEDGPVAGCRGSLSYAAPENLRSQTNKSCQLDASSRYEPAAADIWSLGVVLFVIMYGYTPWDLARESSFDFRMYKANDGSPNSQPWNRMSTAIKTLFNRTLTVRPNRRWTSSGLKAYISSDLGWNPEKFGGPSSPHHQSSPPPHTSSQ